jgi:hypothetical protein
MRRAPPTAGLSPQLVKHFAIAAVSITALLALFATEADWGAQAQLEAVDAKNRLTVAQAEKLGTEKLKSKLKVRRGSGGQMAMDSGSDMGSGGGGYDPAPEPRFDGGPRPGQTEFDREAAGPRGPQPAVKPKKETKRAPSAEEMEALLEASRQRSGSTGAFD